MKAVPNFHNFIDTLPETVRSDIDAASSERRVAQGQCIYRQGDESHEMYQLVSGAVRMCNYSSDGREVITGSFLPGDCFGEMGLIDGLPRLSHSIASEDCVLRVLPQREFDRLYALHPQISKQLNRMLTLRLRLLYSLSEDVRTLSLRQRLGRMLVRLVYSHGVRDEQGQFVIGTSHDELSRTLGASRQSVSKELKTLEQEGLLEIRYGKIYVRDLTALAAEFEALLGEEQVTPQYPAGQIDSP
jgi:CRP-like cAMP-binding protein